MITLNEIKEMPEARRVLRIYAIAAVIWLAALLLLVQIRNIDRGVTMNIRTGDQILNSALLFRAYPRTGTPSKAVTDADPLTVLTQIVETLGLKDRVQQLQSNASGILLQVQQVYGVEMQEFLETIESRGLEIKTAELRTLPKGSERLLSATILLEQKK